MIFTIEIGRAGCQVSKLEGSRQKLKTRIINIDNKAETVVCLEFVSSKMHSPH